MPWKRVAIILLLIQAPQALALPYLEVSRLQGRGAVELAIVREDFALLAGVEGLVLLGEGERRLNMSGDLRVTNGEELFVQSGGTLYAISRDGAVKVADCEGCTFIPHSRGRYALLTRDGLLLRFDGEERRLNLRPQVAKWSEDGNYLVALSGSTVSLISKQGLLWSVSLNTQVFDVDLSDSVVVVTTKNCEIYAYSIRGGVAWTNRLCSCCIPLKLASSKELVAVVLQGKEIALLDPASGRVLQRLNVPAYSAQMGSGLLAAVDSQGVVHIFADSGGLRVEGKSLGALLLWDLPEWLRGELSYEAGDEVGNVRISRESFIPLMSQGNLTLVLRDRSGVEVRRDVFVKPLEVKLTPDGHVEVRGDGALSIRSQGRVHEGTNAIVDTGFLPEYTVEILNYGVPVGKYSCYNSRFTLVAAAISAALLLAAVKLLSGRRRVTHGAGDKG